MRARTVMAFAAIVMTAAAVSGCSDNPTPTALGNSKQQKSEPKDSTPEPEPEPSQSAPAMPKTAKSHTDNAAGAFVQYFVTLYNYGLDTGDHAAIDDVAEADCEKCGELYPPAPQRIEDAHWKPAGPISYGVEKDPYTATVFLPMKTAAGKLYEGTDSKPTTLAAYSWTLKATLSWKGKTWGIKALDVDS